MALCVCAGTIYLQLSGRLCLVSHMNFIYASVCVCVCTQNWVHCNRYNNWYTGTCGAAFKFMLRFSPLCKMPTESSWLSREREREVETSFAGQKAAVCACICVYVCMSVCMQHFAKSAVRLALSLGALFI